MLREKWVNYAKDQSKKCIEYQKFYSGMKTQSTVDFELHHKIILNND